MSSYIVDNKCMNRIINGLFWKHRFKDIHSSLYEDMGLQGSEDFQKLGDKLFKLNTDAVNYRYSKKEPAPKFRWQNGVNVSDIQLLKSLQCLTYQCLEGNIPKRKLYKWLTDVVDCLQSYIIYQLPEYEKAEWG
jgi:hypothetical protein